MLDPYHMFSSRQAEEEYSKLKMRLEAIKRSEEEAAAKIALENKEASTENNEATKENIEAAKIVKEAVLEKETEDSERIAYEYTNEPAAKENKDATSFEGEGMNEEEASVDENYEQVVKEVEGDLEKKEVAATENNKEEMQDGEVLPEKSNKGNEIENDTEGADEEDLIPTFENQQENATELFKGGFDIEDNEPAVLEKNVKNLNINTDPASEDDEDDISNDAVEVSVDFHQVEH